MRRSMTEWERYTCMNFRPATQQDPNVVRFQNGVGCNSQLGMVGGVQVLNLQAPGCRFKGLYLHEIGHALGLVHEHQLPDRDNYIEILYQNVSPHMRIWFNKYSSKEVNQRDVPYEYSSVMHYGITAFSKDGESQTIRAKDKDKEKTIGKVFLKELAYTDVKIVNRMYNCSAHCTNEDRCGPQGHLDQNCNCICRDGSSDCDTTKRNVDRNCRNLYDSWSCYIWANQGECERNKYYMEQQCAKACGVCGNQGEDAAAQNILWPWQWFPMFANMMPKEWMAIGSCKDTYLKTKCAVWKERGDCATNARWMKINCKATCDFCGDEGSSAAVRCSNTYSKSHKCDEWALGGECEVNRQWMFENCRKSCRLCDKDSVDGGEDGDDVDEDKLRCVDTHETCERWASSGECSNNPTWMIPNCRKACGKCDDVRCVDTHETCERWASSGECSNNPTWMIPNCRKACGKCDDGTCKNLYEDTQCEIWAQKLKCIEDATWMGKHCAKSCRRGICEGKEPDGNGKSTPRTTTRPDITTRWSRKTTRRTTTPQTTDSTCRNKHGSDTQCDIWAKNDHCNINPGWMLKFCSKACGQCTGGGGDGGGGGGRSTTKGTIETGGDGDCVDTHASCPTWAKFNYCDTNPQYNLVNCKKSCNNCNGCRDAEFLCSVWAKADNCARNPRYMLRHCQKSCNVCSKSNDEIISSTETKKATATISGGGNEGEDGNSSTRHADHSVLPLLLSFVFAILLVF
ncbi:metalloendopeptidase [Plakobranchus ocellatus]|uniref:Metalloendopeptidase n=1 Tax=Plakobranchus ocellatus TaxID=259542 RepID=A0AAV3ZKE1_9GAST|nr:metalloendopeptidase [Plakobranchus ocellatus]